MAKKEKVNNGMTMVTLLIKESGKQKPQVNLGVN